MFPEKLSIKLIELIADHIDSERNGVAIEIGVGTNNFYSVTYAELGFKTIAVDPIPYQPFLTIAKETGILFDASCIYLHNGEEVIYMNAHSDLSSLHKNWWGSDQKQQMTVKSQTFASFLEKYQIQKISFIKIDTEGSEYEILQQFANIPAGQLPTVLEFEYGGGGTRSQQIGGWAPSFYSKTLDSLKLLKELGYAQGMIFDSIRVEPVIFSFDKIDDLDQLFEPRFEYGNLIAFKETIVETVLSKVKANIESYQNTLIEEYIAELKADNIKLYRKLISKDLLGRAINKIKRIMRR